MGAIPQTVPEKPSKFLHCIVSGILQAAEWVLQTTWGLCWGGSRPPPPLPRTPFLPSLNICYYNNKGQWRVLEVKLGDDLGSWLLLVLSIVTPTMPLRRKRSPSFNERTEERRRRRRRSTSSEFYGTNVFSFISWAGINYFQYSRLRFGPV